MNTKLGFATLALGSFLTLLAPAVAVARDRDDYRQDTSFRDNRNEYRDDYRDNYRQRERIRLERERRERFERFQQQQRWNRDHGNDWRRY